MKSQCPKCDLSEGEKRPKKAILDGHLYYVTIFKNGFTNKREQKWSCNNCGCNWIMRCG